MLSVLPTRLVGPAIALLAALVTASGCTSADQDDSGVDLDRVREFISGPLADQMGVPLGEVDCPTPTDTSAGAGFACTARTDGQQVTVELTFTGEGMAVDAEVRERILGVAALEQALDSEVGARLGADVDIDCGNRGLIVAEPGQTHECSAAAPDGSSSTVLVEVGDEDWSWTLG